MKKDFIEIFNHYNNVNIFSDEENIPKNIVEDLELEDYCIKTKQGWKISFVGFVMRENTIIISFPKNYIREIHNINIDDVLLLSNLVGKITTNSPVNWDSRDVKNSFPLKAYLDICNYYIQNGFYFSQLESHIYGYSGKINWQKTIRSSPNYILEEQVHYIPYVISKKKHIETIITNTMKHVLKDGYDKVGKFFNIGVPYFKQDFKRITSYHSVLSELRYLQSKVFNDFEYSLITSLITYLEWITGRHNEIIMITMNFETVWQKIVNNYLNMNLDKVLSLSKHTDKIKIEHNKIVMLDLNQVIKQKERMDRKVIYDYLASDGKYVLLFDSKYYMNIDKHLDYKQLSYHYLIRLHESVSKEQTILNALLAPTEVESHSDIHIDLTANSNHALFKDVRILIFNLNTKDVINNYVSEN